MTGGRHAQGRLRTRALGQGGPPERGAEPWALLDGRFLPRARIANFRATRADIAALPEIVTLVGRAADAKVRGTKA